LVFLWSENYSPTIWGIAGFFAGYASFSFLIPPNPAFVLRIVGQALINFSSFLSNVWGATSEYNNPRKQMKKTLSALVLFALIANTLFWLAQKDQPRISAENGPMENFQLVCLGMGFFLWLAASFSSKDGGKKTILLSLALFHVSFFVLELDTRDFDAPLLNKSFNGRIRDAWLGALWLLATIVVFRQGKSVLAAFLDWLKTSSGIVMLLSGIFWLVSGLIDKSLLGHKDLYCEELMEVNATLLMLISAVLFCRTVPMR